MKKALALVLSLLMLMTAAAIPAAAVDNYSPKTVYLVANADGTCSLPDGYVVYIGDTIVVPRKEMSYVGDFVNKNTGETEKDAVIFANSYKVFRDKSPVASIWSDSFELNEKICDSANGWKENGATMAKAGTYSLVLEEGRDGGWTTYYDGLKIDIITFEVVDPKTVDEIVVPSATVETSSSETASTTETSSETASVAETSSAAASSEAVSSQATSSAAASSEATSSAAAADNEPKNGTPWLWIVIAAVAVAAVVVIVLATKKKK